MSAPSLPSGGAVWTESRKCWIVPSFGGPSSRDHQHGVIPDPTDETVQPSCPKTCRINAELYCSCMRWQRSQMTMYNIRRGYRSRRGADLQSCCLLVSPCLRASWVGRSKAATCRKRPPMHQLPRSTHDILAFLNCLDLTAMVQKLRGERVLADVLVHLSSMFHGKLKAHCSFAEDVQT